jgi:hypothetical protein
MSSDDPRIYDALALPPEALSNGGAEILRVGIIANELYVQARRAFKDPARWGEVLADIARELALYHSAEDTSLTEEEILTQIEQAFAADLGAPVVEDEKPAKARSTQPATKAKAKTPAKAPAKPARKSTKKSATPARKAAPKSKRKKK